MNNPLIRKIGATAIAVLLLVYVGYQIYLSQYTGLKTETATYSTVSETIDTTGFIIRDEEIVDTNYNGVLNYTVDDGEKVADLTDLKTSNYSSGNVQMVLEFWGGGGDPWVAFNALDPFVLVNASYKASLNLVSTILKNSSIGSQKHPDGGVFVILKL